MTVNTQGTSGGSVTEVLPAPQFAIITQSGDAITGFDCALHAANWARKMWPDQEQDEARTGKGWDISIIGAEK